jgi:hypothetical protein
MKIVRKIFLLAAFVAFFLASDAQSNDNSLQGGIQENEIIEIRSYNLKPGTRNEFQKLFVEQSLPLLKKWKVEVVAYGPSGLGDDSWFLIRAYKDTSDRQRSEDAFYGSDDWKKGPRESVLAMIITYTTIVLPSESLANWSTKIKNRPSEKIE